MCIDANQKTIKSVDFTTNCPKRREGKPCAYCYVENARKLNFNAKHIVDHRPYTGNVKYLPKSTIDKLNSIGGIRLFSFGDYMVEHSPDILSFLDDCLKFGLKVKVITKVIDFVDKFHNHPAINVIHLSIDNIGSGINHDIAKIYRKKYHKVRIRCVVLRDNDLEILASISDLFTFNHGNNGFTNYSSRYNKVRKQELISRYGLDGKICCEGGECIKCKVKCLS